ncbi:predicted protein, partial [Nematostella vectensis]
QVVFCATKQWIPNTNWDNPANWAPGKVPCPQQNVFLGSRLSAKPLAIALSSDASVHSLVRDKVCKFVSCEPTRCDSPLDPDGSCCSVCGALIKLKYTEGFKLRDFKKKVLKIFSEGNNDKNRRALKEDTSVELSISRIEGDQVQVVLTDNEN